MKRRKKADQVYDYGTHEALHGASILADTWALRIVNHPRIQENREWAKQAEKALEEMMELYRIVGISQ